MDYNNMSKEQLIEALKDSQEINKKLLALMEMHNAKLTEISIKSLEEQIKNKVNFIANLEDAMPPKFFKSSYNEWSEKIKTLNQELESLNQELYKTYEEYGHDLMEISKKNEDNN